MVISDQRYGYKLFLIKVCCYFSVTHSRVRFPFEDYCAPWLDETCIGAGADVTAMLRAWGVTVWSRMVRGRDEPVNPAVKDCEARALMGKCCVLARSGRGSDIVV